MQTWEVDQDGNGHINCTYFKARCLMNIKKVRNSKNRKKSSH